MKKLEQKIYLITIFIYLILAIILVIADLTHHWSTSLVRIIASLYLLVTIAYALFYWYLKKQ